MDIRGLESLTPRGRSLELHAALLRMEREIDEVADSNLASQLDYGEGSDSGCGWREGRVTEALRSAQRAVSNARIAVGVYAGAEKDE